MSDFTEHYGFQKLRAGEHFSENSYKFTQADRDLIDRLLFLGAEGHRHTGGDVDLPVLEEVPRLTVNTGNGSMPTGTRFFYKYTLVDTNGFETAASPETFIDTPAGVTPPTAPVATLAATGGTLPPGNFYYVLSAYTGFNNLETTAGQAVFVSVPYANGLTNVITLELPPLPRGADGFNVYRRTPSGSAYYHIGSIDMSGDEPPATFVDNGAAHENCDRMAPEVSTALSRNSITIAIPGETPSVPAGYAWRIYRSQRAGDFANSLLVTIADGSLEFTDTGLTTQSGQPPTQGIAPGAPTQIVLTDAREVQGRLPMSAISAYPFAETFSYPGPVVPLQGTTVWVCPFPQATITEVRLALGRGSVAATRSVIVDINHQRGTGAFASIYANQSAQPTIAVGQSVGPVFATHTMRELRAGDMLTVDIDQDGGGPDPTDSDLTVVIMMLVYGFTVMVSHPWAAIE